MAEEHEAQGLTQATQEAGSMAVDPYMPVVHWATQNCEELTIERKG